MAGKLTFTLQEYQEAAVKYRADLLMLPIIGIGDTLQYMTGRPGIRYKERVGNLTGDAQFAPYNPQRAVDYNLGIEFRDLETYFGSVVANFEPNSAISTLLGTGATKGDGQMTTPTARHVLALIAKNLSEHLNDAIWNGRRNAAGDTTADLFDGFDTITEKEIAAGAIAADEGNYMKITDEITPANAVDIAKSILFSLDPRLRSQDLYLYCSQDFVDKYNEGYLLTDGGIPYNTQYGQGAVEGSNGKLKFCPLYNKAGSKFMHVTTKSNMFVGYGQMGEKVLRVREMYNWFIANPNGTDREFVAEVCQRHNIHRTTAYSDLAVVKSLLPMLGSASRDFHRWRTNEMLIATYKMAEKRKDSKTMERAATAYGKLNRVDLEDE